MSKQETTALNLHSELTHFGLNPSEWTLHRIDALIFVIQNKMDANYQMSGRLEYRKQKARWRSLELISI